MRLASHDPRSGHPLLVQLAGALEPSADQGFILKRRLYAFLCQSPVELRRPALQSWGIALSAQTRTKQGAEAHRLLEAARGKLLAAEQIHGGPGAYSLACLEALQGSAENAVGWLRRLLASGLPFSRKDIAQHPDFDRVRDDPIFRAFLESLPAG
jgi:hypothetical protein